jgi:hypothetical protein
MHHNAGFDAQNFNKFPWFIPEPPWREKRHFVALTLSLPRGPRLSHFSVPPPIIAILDNGLSPAQATA